CPLHQPQQDQTNTAARLRPQTGRLRDRQKCPPPRAPAACKILRFPQWAAARIRFGSAPAPSPVPAPAPAPVRFLLATHAWAVLSAVSAAPPASPSCRCSTLPTDFVATVGFPPPGINDHHRDASNHIRETIGRCCSALPARDTFPVCRCLARLVPG